MRALQLAANRHHVPRAEPKYGQRCAPLSANASQMRKDSRPDIHAFDHDADIAKVKVQEWLGHANIATTRIYDRRKMKPEDSPTFSK